jgi:hypothetical protein
MSGILIYKIYICLKKPFETWSVGIVQIVDN